MKPASRKPASRIAAALAQTPSGKSGGTDTKAFLDAVRMVKLMQQDRKAFVI